MIGDRTAEQQRLAITSLTDRILITRRSDEEAYRAIYIHEEWTRDWFWERTQWRLLGGSECYRLGRSPSHLTPGRGLPGLSQPLDYACLCWALWFLSSRSAASQQWFYLSDYARQIQQVSGGRLSVEERPHREALIRVLDFLGEAGVVHKGIGDTTRFIGEGSTDAESEAVFDFQPGAARMLCTAIQPSETPPSDVNRLVRVADTTPPLTRAWRLLLTGPAFWQADDPEAFAALLVAEDAIKQELSELLHWSLESTPQYARIWRTATARGANSDLLIDLLPRQGEFDVPSHVKFGHHPVLLVCGQLRTAVQEGRYLPAANGELMVTLGEIRLMITALAGEHQGKWGSSLQKMSAEPLIETVMDRLRGVGYLRGPDQLGQCYFLPVAATITGHYPDVQLAADEKRRSAGPTGQQTLLDLMTPGEESV